MDTAQQPSVRDDAAVRTWQLVREPFTARAWRRVAHALPVGLVGLVGAPVGPDGGHGSAVPSPRSSRSSRRRSSHDRRFT
ncbi:hypothetical protein QF035_007019 [Streptomyces umbrinus]|uniref:Uncharacterized protein n=1 Tax=Streptomyces umbrinus TaxID=67370 RepID=A0ABU0T1M0_9ACTN|nr:hypothetical protein [Streptomyces umbrinus]MDQ1029437.1 hypothetical protein [Streptomyces umbrinus]